MAALNTNGQTRAGRKVSLKINHLDINTTLRRAPRRIWGKEIKMTNVTKHLVDLIEDLDIVVRTNEYDCRSGKRIYVNLSAYDHGARYCRETKIYIDVKDLTLHVDKGRGYSVDEFDDQIKQFEEQFESLKTQAKTKAAEPAEVIEPIDLTIRTRQATQDEIKAWLAPIAAELGDNGHVRHDNYYYVNVTTDNGVVTVTTPGDMFVDYRVGPDGSEEVIKTYCINNLLDPLPELRGGTPKQIKRATDQRQKTLKQLADLRREIWAALADMHPGKEGYERGINRAHQCRRYIDNMLTNRSADFWIRSGREWYNMSWMIKQL